MTALAVVVSRLIFLTSIMTFSCILIPVCEGDGVMAPSLFRTGILMALILYNTTAELLFAMTKHCSNFVMPFKCGDKMKSTLKMFSKLYLSKKIHSECHSES